MKKALLGILLIGLVVCTFLEWRYFDGPRFSPSSPSNSSINMLSAYAQRGEKKEIRLSDGTRVYLNAASTLCYPADMSTGNRQVQLVGEAYFDVVKDDAHPFIVSARDVTIHVLGTRFYLRGYPDELKYRTVVTSGVIQVAYNNKKSMVRAGEEIEVAPGGMAGDSMAVEPVKDTNVASNWIKGLLTVSNIDLHGLIRDLSRAYNIDIKLQGEIPGGRFNGTISLNEPVVDAVDRLVGPYGHVTTQSLGKRSLLVTIGP